MLVNIVLKSIAYVEKTYDVKIKYNCTYNNVATMYSKLGTSYINGKLYSIEETTMGSINGQPLIGYKIQIGNTIISGNEGTCLSSGYRFDKLEGATLDENCGKDAVFVKITDYGCECKNNTLIYDSYSKTCISQSIPSSSQNGNNNDNSQNNNDNSQNNDTKNQYCLNLYGQFAIWNDETKECECEGDFALFDNQYCMEGKRYCKLMHPNEKTYYDSESRQCLCDDDKYTMEDNYGNLLCYEDEYELCRKLIPNSHYDENSEDMCVCNEGHKMKYDAYEKNEPIECVLIEDETSSTFKMMITLLFIILVML